MLFKESNPGLGVTVRSCYGAALLFPLLFRQLSTSLGDVSAGFHTRGGVYQSQDLPCRLSHQTPGPLFKLHLLGKARLEQSLHFSSLFFPSYSSNSF